MKEQITKEQENPRYLRDYLGADSLEGPILVVEAARDAMYGEVVEVLTADGTQPARPRLGRVLEAGDQRAVIELWGDSSGLQPHEVQVRFLGRPFQAPVAREMLGRVFDGLGRPRDDLPAPLAEARVDVNGAALNPVVRRYPHDFIQTGITAIDGMNTLVRGQKLPIFSGAGLPHNELAAQIVHQARILGSDEPFAIVFAALGVPHDTADFFYNSFAAGGALRQTALFLNLADDPPMERIITPRVALSLAEFLAFEREMHVLVLMTDMTSYAEAMRELASRRDEVPSRKGYPGYLYSDLASLYERCGRVEGRPGSITQMPILTMLNDDITHPIPDLTGYITEGQIVLSRELHRQGVYPPIAVLPSLSRLMKDGIGAGRTRDDHPHLANQLYAAYAQVQQVQSLADIIGEEALSSVDKAYLTFGRAFEGQFVAQHADEVRTIDQTLDLGWSVLAQLPSQELTRLTPAEIQAHYQGKLDHTYG
ncbi:MAG: V-type ATP synthase subunit B [Caldilineaceae bacterium]